MEAAVLGWRDARLSAVIQVKVACGSDTRPGFSSPAKTAGNALPGDRSRVPDEHYADVFGNAKYLHAFGPATRPPFGFFDWFLKPHLYCPVFPHQDDAWVDHVAARADFPVYFLDDESAIRGDGDGDEVDVVSEGRWRFIP